MVWLIYSLTDSQYVSFIDSNAEVAHFMYVVKFYCFGCLCGEVDLDGIAHIFLCVAYMYMSNFSNALHINFLFHERRFCHQYFLLLNFMFKTSAIFLSPGNKVEVSTIEEWSNKEKNAVTKTSSCTGKLGMLYGDIVVQLA